MPSLSTAYGTEVEKANLLAGLLDGAGFKAEPMATYQAYADKGLALKAVDQLFVSCMVNGELYLFSTSSTHRPQTVNFDRTPLFSLQTGKTGSYCRSTGLPDQERHRSSFQRWKSDDIH